MKKAKWIVATFLAISLMFTLCACNKDDEKKDDEEDPVTYSVEIEKCEIQMSVPTKCYCYFNVVYTNLGDESSSFYDEDLEFRVYYNGVELDTNFDGTGYDEKSKKVKPDASVTIKMIFELEILELRDDCEILEVEIEKGEKVVKRQSFNIWECFAH